MHLTPCVRGGTVLVDVEVVATDVVTPDQGSTHFPVATVHCALCVT